MRVPRIIGSVRTSIAVRAEERCAFCALDEYGLPPTLRNARTGLFTPPGMIFGAIEEGLALRVGYVARHLPGHVPVVTDWRTQGGPGAPGGIAGHEDGRRVCAIRLVEVDEMVRTDGDLDFPLSASTVVCW